jgi:thiol-disulfide isomerase/thioredoxin
MTATTRLTTLLLVLLTRAVSAQDAAQPYAQEMRKGDAAMTRRVYEDALVAYKKAFSLSNKTSLDAVFAMAMAYRGLGANKNVVDLMNGDGTKLAGSDPINKAKMHNMRGTALASLSEKPTDRKLEDAIADFRAALAANPKLYSAQLNLGITLLKQEHDEDGKRELQTYVDTAPKGPETERALKMIEEPRRAREIFAPDFSFTSKDGEFITSEDLRGKTVLIDFWGTWCGPCVRATPGLVKLQKKFAEQPVVFISVAENDREEQWAAYIEKNKMVWPQFFDKSRKLVEPFGIRGFPTYVVIDGDGVVRWRFTGYGSDTDGTVESEIKKTLKKKG